MKGPNVFGFFKASPPKHLDIIVPQSAVAPGAKEYALMMAVVDWFNKVQNEGGFFMGEMPPAAPQAYHADYYLAQVNNGGHAQFALNSGMSPITIGWALAGLEAAGLSKIHECLDDLNGMGVSPGNMSEYHALVASKRTDHLDSKFFEHSKGFYPAFNAYLLEHVVPVPDEAYAARIAQQIALDDTRKARKQARHLLVFESGMLDAHRMASGIGVLGLGGMIQAFGNGGYISFLGESVAQMVVFVRGGGRAFVLNIADMESFWISGAEIRGKIEPEAIIEYAKISVRVPYARIRDEVEILREKRYGRVLGWVLQELGLAEGVQSVAPRIANKPSLEKGEAAQYAVAHKDGVFVFEVSDASFALARLSTDQQGKPSIVKKGQTAAALKAANAFVEKASPK